MFLLYQGQVVQMNMSLIRLLNFNSLRVNCITVMFC